MAESRGSSIQQVAQAGEYFVAAERNKRGAFAVTVAGNMPKIDHCVQLRWQPHRLHSSEDEAWWEELFCAIIGLCQHVSEQYRSIL